MVSGLALLGVVSWFVGIDDGRQGSNNIDNPEPDRLTVEVVGEYPHDRSAYTQGLLWYGDRIYESTGRYGQSSIRRIDPASGEVEAAIDVSPEYFGEGLARVGERLIQLTWRAGVAFVRDLATLEELDRLRYEGEGWGLCHDGRQLVMSDGSSFLSFRDSEGLGVLRRLEVTLQDRPVGRLNELECAEGWVYANVYTTDWIVRIDPQSGRVVALIDASSLLRAGDATGVDVLNGIAYNPQRQTFYLTGKLWPKLFEVRFVSADESHGF